MYSLLELLYYSSLERGWTTVQYWRFYTSLQGSAKYLIEKNMNVNISIFCDIVLYLFYWFFQLHSFLVKPRSKITNVLLFLGI